MNPFKRRMQDTVAGPTTYITRETTIVGKVSGKGAYVCSGSIEGDCDIDGTLTITESGRWTGTLRATNVLIGGTITGDVIAAQRVEVAGSAKISGSVTGGEIAVAEGAVIDGDIRVTSAAAPKIFQEKRKA